MNRITSAIETPVLVYARFLLTLHALDLQGKHNSEEATAVREQMDLPWYAMTAEEQERMGGLSEDLYAIEKGGPPIIRMTDQELNAWREELEFRKKMYEGGDIDGWLGFWRKARPSNFPPPHGIPVSVVHFFQAQSWERLGDYHTAVIFMMAGERTDPELSGLVLYALHQAGNYLEERKYANRILNDSNSKPIFMCMAASFLFSQVDREANKIEPLCHRLIPILKQALEKEQHSPSKERVLPETEMYLAELLGMCFEILNKDRDALSVYDNFLAHYPRSHEIWLRRGIVLHFLQNFTDAYDNFLESIQLGSTRCVPYLFLAQREFNSGHYWKAYEYAKAGSEKRGTEQMLSLTHQIIAMSLSMVNQPLDWVLDNFKIAEMYDPRNPFIAQNRAVAISRADKSHSTEPWKLQTLNRFDVLEAKSVDIGYRINQRMVELASVA